MGFITRHTQLLFKIMINSQNHQKMNGLETTNQAFNYSIIHRFNYSTIQLFHHSTTPSGWQKVSARAVSDSAKIKLNWILNVLNQIPRVKIQFNFISAESLTALFAMADSKPTASDQIVIV